MSSRFTSPVSPLPAAPTETLSSSDRQNSVEAYSITSLNLLDDDVNRLEAVLGIAADATVGATNYTSNRLLTDGMSIVTALSTLDANATLDINVVKTDVVAKTGTISTVDGSKTFTVDTSTDVVTCNTHGLVAGQPLRVSSTTSLPGGLSTGTDYYAGNITTNTFKLYTIKAEAIAGIGASLVNITTTGTGTHSLDGTFVHGVSTLFSSELTVGRHIYIDGLSTTDKVFAIATIVDDTTLALSETITQTSSGLSFKQLLSVIDPLVFQLPPLIEADATVNNQAVRLSQVQNLIKLPKGFMAGPMVRYGSASTFIIPQGFTCRDTGDTMDMRVTGDITVSVATPGANGLDSGIEASNTFYYLYLIGDSTGTNPLAAVFSTVNESASGSITLPSGYNTKRQLPVFARNDGSSNFIPVDWMGPWDHPEFIFYGTTNSYNGSIWTAGTVLQVLGAGTSGTWASVSLTGLLAPICSHVHLQSSHTSSSSAYFQIRKESGSAIIYALIDYDGRDISQRTYNFPCTTTQTIDYIRLAGTGTLTLDVLGGRVDGTLFLR